MQACWDHLWPLAGKVLAQAGGRATVVVGVLFEGQALSCHSRQYCGSNQEQKQAEPTFARPDSKKSHGGTFADQEAQP